MIEVRNVTKVYGKGDNALKALDNVSLGIPEGTSVAILGKSGSGKSTLMHVMSGLDRATSGQVVIGGEDIMSLKAKKIDKFRAQKIGFIFQSFFVRGNETVYDNVSLPLEITRVSRGERKTRVEEALKAVELDAKIRQKAKNLSGGQKQRLAIARAIVHNPQIIFADEPTGNLDTTTGSHIEKLLFGYNRNKGTTLIIVTHDPDLARKCDMQVIIKDGRIEKVLSSGESAKKSPSKDTSASKKPAELEHAPKPAKTSKLSWKKRKVQ